VTAPADAGLARRLVLDELFDLSLYRALRDVAPGDLRRVLDELIPVETRHHAFWQKFFGLELNRLNLGRRLKLALIVALCRLGGAPAIRLILEAIEVHGVRKYLAIWHRYGEGPLGGAVREVLRDEFEHEDAVVTGDAERRINPERVRSIFLGLNDGLVEILGAISGFFAAFGASVTVLVAGLTVAVAGALSMAASAYVAASSASEVRAAEEGRRQFLGERPAEDADENALMAAVVVGASYFAGALVPVLPVLAGARTALPSVLAAGTMIVVVSALVAFLSGMDLRRRVATNVMITALAVLVTYAIGLAAKALFGVSV
jgi:VIT1/CCC1 family predicted Fe2+/Mn2+ transporter